MTVRWRLASAKINLFLHVGPKQADGYHPVCSLMLFADVGDEVRLDPGGEGLSVEGPFAAGLAGEGDNLVARARDRFVARFGAPTGSFGLTLDKRLPIAAGLGGGSADAAATLHLLAAQSAVNPADPDLLAIAGALGADVTACLAGHAVMGEGRGDVLTAPPVMPVLDAVLVNPGVPSSTPAVYRAFDDAPAGPGADRPDLPPVIRTAREAADVFSGQRNDLEAPAIALDARIGEALSVLAAQPESLLARMSGSGATCFALTETADAASRMAERISAAHPGWWVRACRLG